MIEAEMLSWLVLVLSIVGAVAVIGIDVLVLVAIYGSQEFYDEDDDEWGL